MQFTILNVSIGLGILLVLMYLLRNYLEHMSKFIMSVGDPEERKRMIETMDDDQRIFYIICVLCLIVVLALGFVGF